MVNRASQIIDIMFQIEAKIRVHRVKKHLDWSLEFLNQATHKQHIKQHADRRDRTDRE